MSQPKYRPAHATSTPKFEGIKTFMRLPHVRTTEDIDFAIIGVPFDTLTGYKNGARFGPSAIREASPLMRDYSMDLDVNVFQHLSGVDYGDLDITPGYAMESYAQIEAGMKPFMDAGVVPVVMGGDHSITLPQLRAVAKKHGPVALVHFDSHLDTWVLMRNRYCVLLV